MRAQSVRSIFGTEWLFFPHMVEYKICLFYDVAKAAERYDSKAGYIAQKLYDAFEFNVRSDLIADEEGHLSYYIRLHSRDDTVHTRERIASIIEEHLATCCELAGMCAEESPANDA